jgi:hypothetical protein
MNIADLKAKFDKSIERNGKILFILDSLAEKGFPFSPCKVKIQLTQDNSLLFKKLKRDGEPFIEDVIEVQERGLVTGIRTQKGHKMLTEWDKILEVL